MKLKKVTIEGFRGTPRPLELKLEGKSLCLLGENGRGKTTIVDALEYWSTGKLDGFEREGYKLDAAINLDHGAPATVECEREGGATLRRSLNGANADDLEAINATEDDSQDPPRLPILRHRTMAQFMDRSSGDKKRELLQLLGLEGLIKFRDVLETATKNAANSTKGANKQAKTEADKLSDLHPGTTLLECINKLLGQAGIPTPIASPDDLLTLTSADTPAVKAGVDRAELVEDILRLSAELNTTPQLSWNDIISDRRATEAEVLTKLVEAGRTVLQRWDHNKCPLCLQDYDREKLDKSLATRAAELAEREQAMRSARAELSSHGTRTHTLASKIKQLLDASPEDGWPATSILKTLGAELITHKEQIDVALSGPSQCPEIPDGSDLSQHAETLRQAARASHSPAMQARIGLERVRLHLQRSNEANTEANARKSVEQAISALHDRAQEQIKATVENAIVQLGQTVANFYGKLVLNPVYTDIELEYTERRSGGIEFKLMFDRRHPVSPPQRVVSESQLNALGLAFFLARVKAESESCRILVLDDVVNSFDADHRMGLARLLSEEFSDWQVLLFTHDNVFVSLAEPIFVGWKFWQIAAWHPTTGPMLRDADPLRRLKARLNAGETASDLGGLAREALERSLSRPIERLRFPMPFDRRSLHSAAEYLDALTGGLKERQSPLKDMPVLKRIKGERYLVNLGSHDRPTDPTLSSEDLRQLVADLEEMESEFRCTDCGEPFWYAQKNRRHGQCECGALKV